MGTADARSGSHWIGEWDELRETVAIGSSGRSPEGDCAAHRCGGCRTDAGSGITRGRSRPRLRPPDSIALGGRSLHRVTLASACRSHAYAAASAFAPSLAARPPPARPSNHQGDREPDNDPNVVIDLPRGNHVETRTTIRRPYQIDGECRQSASGGAWDRCGVGWRVPRTRRRRSSVRATADLRSL